jgi:hypothetical protein
MSYAGIYYFDVTDQETFVSADLAITWGNIGSVRSEVLTMVEIQVQVFWVVTPCSVVVGYECFGGHADSIFWVVAQCGVVVGYECFGGPCCLHLLGCDAV